MSQFKLGADALGVLSNNGSEGKTLLNNDFAKFGVGTTYKVRCVSAQDVMGYVGYGIYKKVNTFVAKDPSERNEKGFVTGNPTAWDKASQYYFDKGREAKENGASEKEVKDLWQEAGKYSGKQRFVFGFVDLEAGKEILIDLTKQQAQGVHATIAKYEKKLGKLAFELTKTNATGLAKDTKVALTPIIDFDEDLTDKEKENFAKFNEKEFNAQLFEGLLFEADEKTQKENLVAAGFDLNLIGLTIDADTGGNDSDFASNNEVKAEDYPF